MSILLVNCFTMLYNMEKKRGFFMEIKVKSYNSQASLISSIIYFIIGGILFAKADEVLSVLSLIIGIIMAISGIVSLVIYYINLKKEIPYKNHKNLAYGILLLIISIIFIFFSNIVAQFIRFIIGGWILFTGIIRLINSLSMNNKNNKFIPLLIVSLLLIGVGIYTIVKGDIILSSVGLIMMLYAGIEIIGYIFYSKDKQEVEEVGATSLIVPEEGKEKEEIKETKTNVKDIKEKKKKTKKETKKEN